MPSTTIVMEDWDSNIYVAIDRVADKAGRCIGRRLKRLKGGGRYIRISELLDQEQEACGCVLAKSERAKP